MSTDADFSLDRLWEEGVAGLQSEEVQEDVRPGTTYEVAPGIVGTMPWPTLADREAVGELNEELSGLFREDATAEDFQQLQQAIDGEEDIEEGSSPVREDVTMREWTETTARVNCEKTALLLDFDEDVDPQDINPEMAAVVAAHFTGLVPGANGSNRS